MNKRHTSVNRPALDILLNYSWPRNVGEVENAIERAMVMGLEPGIRPSDFPLQVGSTERPEAGLTLDEVERASLLKIDRVTLYNKIEKSGFQKGVPATS